ncbi:MAG TPA: RNA-binding protein [Lacibacter sp.]|nr:RNA-binding protein [Lacibacter sp.]
MNLYVSNLGFNTGDEELKALFLPFGEVASAKVIMDRIMNKSRGFGFVEMPDDHAANNAIAAINGSINDGREVKVSEARPREERPRNNKW